MVVNHTDGRTVLIVQAYANSKYVGDLTVWFDDEGECTRWEGLPILLNASIEEGKTIYQCLTLR